MNSFVKSLIQPILEQEGQKIALIPGGFKPPTVGHFSLVDEVAKNSNIDKVIVLIGHKNRDGVSKEESKAIWDIYKKYLPSNVEIQIADHSSPIADVISIIKNNPQNTYYPVVGIRGEMDLGDLKRFDSLKGKYDNFQTIVIKSEESDNRVSGTNTRAALIGGEKERFQSYLPTELSDEEKEDVWSILQKTPVDEGTCGYNTDVNTGKKLDTPGGIEEMYAEPSEFSYPPMIKSLTEYMLDKGMNIRPLPKVKFVNDDAENAQNFFGKTAYYNPNERVIVLYTMGRHPKDVMRSYAHEMIHHMQNCDGRLEGITTQNTNEEGDLPEIEREAYEKGNMTFRNWTDTLTEGVFGNKIVCDNCGWSWKIADGGDDLYICHKCGHDNTPSLNEGRYDKISNQISSTIFKQWREDINNGALSSRLEQSFPFGDEEISIDANLSVVPGLEKLNVDGGADDEEDYIEVRFEIDPTFLPEFWEEISMNLKDVIRHEIEHLTHGKGFTANPDKTMEDDMFIRQMIDMKMLPRADYFKLEKEIDANLQGMYFRAKKEKRPFGDVINTYLDAQDITPKQKEEIMNLWRRRLPALNLPKF